MYIDACLYITGTHKISFHRIEKKRLMVFIPFHAQLISSFSLFLSKEKAKLNVQCYIIKIILMISDNLPKGKGEGQDNIMQNCIITSADLPKRCSALMGKGLD